jgi:hypothetical protein
VFIIISIVALIIMIATPKEEEVPELLATESVLMIVALELDVARRSRKEVAEDVTGALTRTRHVRTRVQ